MSEVRRAHTVSKGHLLAWAGFSKKGKVQVGDYSTGRCYQASVNNATVVSNAYRPSLLNHDREGYYEKIESAGTPVLRKLATGSEVSRNDRIQLLNYLEMHRERGSWADQTKVQLPVVRGSFGSDQIEDATMNHADLVALDRSLNPDTLRIEPTADLLNTYWRVVERDTAKLITGDGAVVIFADSSDSHILGITYPISPELLLVIGMVPDKAIRGINNYIALCSRRWLICNAEDTTLILSMQKALARRKHTPFR